MNPSSDGPSGVPGDYTGPAYAYIISENTQAIVDVNGDVQYRSGIYRADRTDGVTLMRESDRDVYLSIVTEMDGATDEITGRLHDQRALQWFADEIIGVINLYYDDPPQTLLAIDNLRAYPSKYNPLVDFIDQHISPQEPRAYALIQAIIERLSLRRLDSTKVNWYLSFHKDMDVTTGPLTSNSVVTKTESGWTWDSGHMEVEKSLTFENHVGDVGDDFVVQTTALGIQLVATALGDSHLNLVRWTFTSGDTFQVRVNKDTGVVESKGVYTGGNTGWVATPITMVYNDVVTLELMPDFHLTHRKDHAGSGESNEEFSYSRTLPQPLYLSSIRLFSNVTIRALYLH